MVRVIKKPFQGVIDVKSDGCHQSDAIANSGVINIENGEKFVHLQVGEFLSCLPNWSKYAKII